MKALFFALTGLLPLAACDPGGGSDKAEPRGSALGYPAQQQRGVGAGGPGPRANAAGQADFLTRVRQADPRQETIKRAVLNEQNELGIILSGQVNMDDIPALARSLLADLATTFPGQNHTVLFYAPTEPPARIGVARLDARTRQMTYTRDQR